MLVHRSSRRGGAALWVIAALLLAAGIGFAVWRSNSAGTARGFSDVGLAEDVALAHFDAEIDDAGAAWKGVAFAACRSQHVRVRQAAALAMTNRITRTAADRDVFDALVALAGQETEDTGPRWCALSGLHRVAPRDTAVTSLIAQIRANPRENADLIRLIDRALR
jgi:hypothetical protein